MCNSQRLFLFFQFLFIMQNTRPHFSCWRSQGTGAHSRLRLPAALKALCSGLPVHFRTRATVYDLDQRAHKALIAVKNRFVFLGFSCFVLFFCFVCFFLFYFFSSNGFVLLIFASSFSAKSLIFSTIQWLEKEFFLDFCYYYRY